MTGGDATFQWAAILLWTLAGLSLLPSVLKAFGRAPRDTDFWKAVLFFAALLFIAFPSRKLVAPTDIWSWRLLYSLSIALAVYVLLLLWNGRKR